MPKVRDSAVRKAAADAADAAKLLRRTLDKAWSSAHLAPLFCREAGVNKHGKPLRRSTRLIGGHAYSIAASGAAAAVVHELKRDLEGLGLKYASRVSSSAMLPTLSKGAKTALEAFLASYVQEALLVATRAQKALGGRKRLSATIVSDAFARTNESIFFASSPAPRATIVVPLRKAKAAADEDFVAPDEAADDEAVAAS